MLAAFIMLLSTVITAAIFGIAAYLGVELSKLAIKASPPPERREENASLTFFLITASAAAGVLLVLRGLLWQDLAMAGVICVCLVACWHGAAITGKMSAYFILIPLGSILVADAAQQNWATLLGPLIVFLPFAVTAYMSKGKNMGWDDAQFAALGGAVLGAWFALLAFAIACIAATVVARIQNKTREPMLFAPYMIASLAVCATATIARAN